MEKLEVKFYSRVEITGIIGVNPKDTNCARVIKNTLTNWGYSFEYSCKGVKILRTPTTAEEKLAELTSRKFDIDTQIDSKTFGLFLYLISNYSDYQASPWIEKVRLLQEEFNITIDEKTLRRWVNKMISSNSIAKSADVQVWRTVSTLEGKERHPIVDDEDIQEMENYFQYRNESLRRADEDYQLATWSGKPNPNRWSIALNECWRKFGCCYYNCHYFITNCIDDDFKEMYELSEEILNNTLMDNNEECAVKITVTPITTREITIPLPKINNGDFIF